MSRSLLRRLRDLWISRRTCLSRLVVAWGAAGQSCFARLLASTTRGQVPLCRRADKVFHHWPVSLGRKAATRAWRQSCRAERRDSARIGDSVPYLQDVRSRPLSSRELLSARSLERSRACCQERPVRSRASTEAQSRISLRTILGRPQRIGRARVSFAASL